MDESKDTLLFVDPCCPRPYDPSNIDKPGGVGGTEQTMVTLAEGLAKTGLFNVVVEQHNRFEGEDFQANALYTHYGQAKKARWVIVLRDPRPMVPVRERFPDSKIYLFSHDLADRNLGICYNAGFFHNSGCIANINVSKWHNTQSVEILKIYGYKGEFKSKVIYNPLSEDVIRTGKPYDKNKLVWLASPHKGLARAYDIFKYLVKFNPDFKLYVTNPGYMENQYTEDQEIKDRVVVLGTLPHKEAVRHLEDSLCLFYPNTVFPETFGKIMAEANAVGTPVLTHDIGASREVLDSHPGQIVNCLDNQLVIKRVLDWNSGNRPIVRGRPEFKLTSVIKSWVNLLHELR